MLGLRTLPAISLLLSTVCGQKPACLNDQQAWEIATKYVALYDTDAVKTIDDINKIVAPSFTNYEETTTGPYSEGPLNVGIDAFLASLTKKGKSSITDEKQYPLYVMHDCNTISYRWKCDATATGYNATVPAGTYLTFKGIDIIEVDLKTLLVTVATSSADWINLARELGQIGTYFP